MKCELHQLEPIGIPRYQDEIKRRSRPELDSGSTLVKELTQIDSGPSSEWQPGI